MTENYVFNMIDKVMHQHFGNLKYSGVIAKKYNNNNTFSVSDEIVLESELVLFLLVIIYTI